MGGERQPADPLTTKPSHKLSRLATTLTALVALGGGLLVAPGAVAQGNDADTTLNLVNRVAPLGTDAPAAAQTSVAVSGATVHGSGVDMAIADQTTASMYKAAGHVVDAAKADYVVRDVKDGFQVVSVTSSPASAAPLSYTFPGKVLELLPDGMVVVRASDHGDPVALIDPAWAKDANGQPVATHYQVAGDTLTQVIQPTESTRFPVVADPQVFWSWAGFSINFSHHETNLLAGGAGGCAAVATIVAATAGNVAAGVVAGSCALLGAWANYAYNEGQCVGFTYLWASPIVIPRIVGCYA